jgi:hypothetical protein
LLQKIAKTAMHFNPNVFDTHKRLMSMCNLSPGDTEATFKLLFVFEPGMSFVGNKDYG